MNKKVVITGLGVLAANGKGKEEFWTALQKGQSGCAPVSLFETEGYSVKTNAEVKDFDAKEYMGKKGLRTLDRATKLMICSAKLAVDDTGFEITDDNTDDVGVSVGTTFGSLKSIADFDEITLTEGPRAVNPAHFPNTVINSPASQVSIWNNIQGFNATQSNGFTSSIDAFEYAVDMIQLEHVKLVLAGSVEEMCWQTFEGMHAVEFLSGSDGREYVNCPFDQRHNGVTFGEGAMLAAFECEKHAKERGAKIAAEVSGFGYYFDYRCKRKYHYKNIGMTEAMKDALDQAGLGITDIDWICANANSYRPADVYETRAIKEVFGKQAYKIPVSSIKSMVGETYSLCGGLGLSAALGAFERGFIPPTINFEKADKDCDLDYVPNKARKADLKHILINTFDPFGGNACMVVSRYSG